MPSAAALILTGGNNNGQIEMEFFDGGRADFVSQISGVPGPATGRPRFDGDRHSPASPGCASVLSESAEPATSSQLGGAYGPTLTMSGGLHCPGLPAIERRPPRHLEAPVSSVKQLRSWTWGPPRGPIDPNLAPINLRPRQEGELG